MIARPSSNTLRVHRIPPEHLRVWDGVDREACRLMALGLDRWMAANPCDPVKCHAMCVCGAA